MNNRAITVALALLLSTPLAMAQPQDSEANHPAGTPTADTSGPSKPPAEPAPETTTTDSTFEQKLEEMQAHWDKILKTQDPVERQKLMDEHRKEMQDLHDMLHSVQVDQDIGMDMMDDSQGQDMMGEGHDMGMMHGDRKMGTMGGGENMGMMHDGSGMMGGGHGMRHGGHGMGKMRGCHAEMRHHLQVERRLELIQKLLEQVLENQIKS